MISSSVPFTKHINHRYNPVSSEVEKTITFPASNTPYSTGLKEDLTVKKLQQLAKLPNDDTKLALKKHLTLVLILYLTKSDYVLHGSTSVSFSIPDKVNSPRAFCSSCKEDNKEIIAAFENIIKSAKLDFPSDTTQSHDFDLAIDHTNPNIKEIQHCLKASLGEELKDQFIVFKETEPKNINEVCKGENASVHDDILTIGVLTSIIIECNEQEILRIDITYKPEKQINDSYYFRQPYKQPVTLKTVCFNDGTTRTLSICPLEDSIKSYLNACTVNSSQNKAEKNKYLKKIITIYDLSSIGLLPSVSPHLLQTCYDRLKEYYSTTKKYEKSTLPDKQSRPITIPKAAIAPVPFSASKTSPPSSELQSDRSQKTIYMEKEAEQADRTKQLEMMKKEQTEKETQLEIMKKAQTEKETQLEIMKKAQTEKETQLEIMKKAQTEKETQLQVNKKKLVKQLEVHKKKLADKEKQLELKAMAMAMAMAMTDKEKQLELMEIAMTDKEKQFELKEMALADKEKQFELKEMALADKEKQLELKEMTDREEMMETAKQQEEKEQKRVTPHNQYDKKKELTDIVETLKRMNKSASSLTEWYDTKKAKRLVSTYEEEANKLIDFYENKTTKETDSDKHLSELIQNSDSIIETIFKSLQTSSSPINLIFISGRILPINYRARIVYSSKNRLENKTQQSFFYLTSINSLINKLLHYENYLTRKNAILLKPNLQEFFSSVEKILQDEFSRLKQRHRFSAAKMFNYFKSFYYGNWAGIFGSSRSVRHNPLTNDTSIDHRNHEYHILLPKIIMILHKTGDFFPEMLLTHLMICKQYDYYLATNLNQNSFIDYEILIKALKRLNASPTVLSQLVELYTWLCNIKEFMLSAIILTSYLKLFAIPDNQGYLNQELEQKFCSSSNQEIIKQVYQGITFKPVAGSVDKITRKTALTNAEIQNNLMKEMNKCYHFFKESNKASLPWLAINDSDIQSRLTFWKAVKTVPQQESSQWRCKVM
ncbi:hypothetical protein [Endozoicomonas sp.]|uniref:hypothetical protein n=1 Tax=Endozoicomonas sp. TaxID=1892382 RepID=UPI00383BF0C7